MLYCNGKHKTYTMRQRPIRPLQPIQRTPLQKPLIQKTMPEMKLAGTDYKWRTIESSSRKIDQNFYIFGTVLITLIVIYALATNSPIMAITFVLIGIVGFITLEQSPQSLQCSISKEGVSVNRSLYTFESIQSFCIIEKGNESYISLKISSALTPFIHIPLGTENPQIIREMLAKSIQEDRHEPGIVDIIENIIHIG